MSPLTTARLAVWQAIDNWTWPMGFVWAKKYQSDEDTAEMMLRGPAPHQFPAISVAWAQMTVEEYLNVIGQQNSPIRVSCWFAADQLSVAETIVEQIVQCVLKSTPDGSTVPYVRKAIGYPPVPIGPLILQSVALGNSGVMSWKLEATFGLRINTDLYSGVE